MYADIKDICLSPQVTVADVISALNRNLKGIVLLVDEGRRLLGSITDGDVRRAFLAGTNLEDLAVSILEAKGRTQPITAPLGTSGSELLKLMKSHAIRQIPLLDDRGRVADLVTMADLVPDDDTCLQAVIMAGGFGTRLRPMTQSTPKPMLPVGDRPVLEYLMEQLRQAGISRVNLATHYLAEKIKEHFGDGSDFGVELNYITEDKPLGTAGALGLMSPPQGPLLVINGDILTRVDFKAMLAFHREQEADLTLGVRKYEMSVPFGVVQCDGPMVRKLVEKPSQSFFVNAGIYLLEPTTRSFIPQGEPLDMTELVQVLLAKGGRVASFPIHEYWLDIGQQDDYRRAQEDVKNGRFPC